MLRLAASSRGKQSPADRRTLRAVLSALAVVLAPLSWAWTIDSPFLRSTGLTAWLLLAVALALSFSAAGVDRRWWVRAVAWLELGVLALFAWLYFGFSRLPATSPRELERAPDFTLPDHLGRPVHLAEALAAGPVLLVFFRGWW